jgi:hypothetical protein
LNEVRLVFEAKARQEAQRLDDVLATRILLLAALEVLFEVVGCG